MTSWLPLLPLFHYRVQLWPLKVKWSCFCTRHSQPLTAACERLWAYKCALRGKEKVKLSYWIDWAFMKLKCALPPASSHVEMTSRRLRRPVWNTAVRIPTSQSGAELLPCRHNSTVTSLIESSRRVHFATYNLTYACFWLYWNNCTIILLGLLFCSTQMLIQ